MREAQDESAPPIAFADAETAMRKGRGGSLFLLAALGLALIGALALFVGRDDQARVYGEIGKGINGLKRTSFDQFWGCALQGVNVNDIKSNAELVTQLGGRAEERGRAYGRHLRDQCLKKLEPVDPQLERLIVPQDLAADVAALKQANNQLRTSVSAFATYLDDPDLDYDVEKAEPQLQQIARAWYEYSRAHADVNKGVKLKLK